MEQVFTFDGKNSLTWRDTPWDQKVFQKKTVELLSVECNCSQICTEMLKAFEADIESELIYGRFNASDQIKKKALLDASYFPCETALDIVLPKLESYQLPGIFRKRKLSIESPDSNVQTQIAEAASRMFNYSRFHEDPYIPVELANQRMSSWTVDLFQKNVPALVHTNPKGKLIAFLFYQTEEKTVDLILGGSVMGQGMYAPFFFGSIIQHFMDQGKKKIRTTVSAANKGILNLYIALGFNVSETKMDYHKHL